ncbi:hypothetical protein [Mesorhizobium sp.]|uniref:hypothetical protein n=1 Tax=Mesorhizobium sp. TaxID=1871066 RepID=UPI0025D5DB0D|nr:hypothetical protein [Mesorhizobium sp.]
MSTSHLNGFRQQQLRNGVRHAAAVNAARLGDASVALSVVIGADKQPKTFVKALLKLAKALPDRVPAYRIVGGQLSVPLLSWGYHHGFHKPRSVRLDWLPSWASNLRKRPETEE